MKKAILNKKILVGSLLIISLGISCQVSAQNQSGDQGANSCVDRIKGRGDSTCVSGTMYASQTHPTQNFQANSIAPFSKPGLSCTTPWGQIIQDNTEVAAYLTPTGTYNYTTGTYADDCVEEQRHCTNGVLSGTYQYQTCTIQPVNGTCGIANGAYYTYPTSGPAFADQCNPTYTYGGIPPSSDSPPTVPASSGAYLNTTTNVYNWTCAGEAGGGSASCFAYRKINGQCGSSTNSCNLGNSANPSSNNNYYPNYTCSCSTNASGVTTCTADPAGNQTCTGGYKDTTYTWNCTGINTGATASCSNNVYVSSNDTPVTPPCGATTQPQSASCPSGYTGTQTRTNTVDSCTGNIITYGTWNTSSCSCSPTYTAGTQSASCPSGYTGTQYRSTSTNSCTGAVTYGAWDTSACTVVCTPTYTNGTQSASCPSGYTGTQYRSTSTNSCTGAVTYGNWDTSGCTAVCTPTYTAGTQSASCPSGYTGTQYRSTSTNSCTGAVTYGNWDTSGCTAVPAGCPTAGQDVNTYCYYEAGGNEGCDTGTFYWGAEVYNNDAACSTHIEPRGSANYSNCPGRQENGSCPGGY